MQLAGPHGCHAETCERKGELGMDKESSAECPPDTESGDERIFNRNASRTVMVGDDVDTERFIPEPSRCTMSFSCKVANAPARRPTIANASSIGTRRPSARCRARYSSRVLPW